MQKLGREVTTLGNYCHYTKNRLWTSCPCFRGGGVCTHVHYLLVPLLSERALWCKGRSRRLREWALTLASRGQVGLWKSQSDIPEAAAHKLQRAQGALAEAEARARRLQRGQVEVRLRTEEARQAVRLSLHRVRELEALARRVPRMQRQVQRLEAELRRYR